MIRLTTFSAALLISTGAALLLTLSAPVFAAAQITNPYVKAPLQVAQSAASEYNYTLAIQLAQRALQAQGITKDETDLVNTLIATWKKIASNPEAVDKRIAEDLRDGRRTINIFKSCVDVAMVLYKQGKTAECSGAAAPIEGR
jgi:predicted RNA-binding protein YlqC (UPF0109 family)